MNPFISHGTGIVGQNSTDPYADVVFTEAASGQASTVIKAITSGPVSFHMKNIGANAIKYRVLASNDQTFADADWAVVVAETSLASGLAASEYLDVARFLFYKLQEKASVGGSQGTMIAAVAVKRY
jgi:hypothetical protein